MSEKRRWRIVDVSADEATDTDLDDAELIGISILLNTNCGLPYDAKYNVYWRAWEKIQPQVETAICRETE